MRSSPPPEPTLLKRPSFGVRERLGRWLIREQMNNRERHPDLSVIQRGRDRGADVGASE